MIFHKKCIFVFLFIVIISAQLGESSNLQGLNMTLFLFNHPKSCKINEFYNLDYFMCLKCESREHMKPSFDKFICACEKSDMIVTTVYDQQNCIQPCTSENIFKCANTTLLPYPENPCNLRFINYTIGNKNGAEKNIRIYSQTAVHGNNCRCDLKYNYVYNEYCIWKPLLKNYLNHNAFWKRGRLYVDLKFIAFFCQSLHNMIACNNLANLCIQSFFDTDKNSPCSVFLLSQASDAALYSSMGENLNGLRPFLFYKKGKTTLQELEEQITFSEGSLNLFSTIFSLDGQLTRWESFQPNRLNLCGHNSLDQYGRFQLFKNTRIACQLTLNSIIDMASIHGNKYFVSVFLNHTREDTNRYLQTIPILIENAFEGNKELNPIDWQLVKRFQIIGVETTFNLANLPIPPYEDSFKIQLFKSIRVLRKFELRCTVKENNKITVPIIVLDYHTIDLSLNTSLSEKYNFEFLVTFQKDASSSENLFGVVLSIFIMISILFASFRAYIFKCRRNLECFDMLVFAQALLYFVSNVGNSFLAVVIIHVFFSVISFLIQFGEVLVPVEKNNLLEFFIYSGLLLKGFCFFFNFWQISQIDIFFVDWERPKNCDTSLHFAKNNLETSSQCSSIRTFSENNVSAWRIFFLANEWIDLSSRQKSSCFVQGFVSLTFFWVCVSTIFLSPQLQFLSGMQIANSYLQKFYLNSTLNIFACASVYCSVQLVQVLFRVFLLDQVIGNPIKKFMDICTLANVSIFTLMDSSFGYYIHGRSPHGFSDTDMSSMIFQLQRESQNMCGKRGLLSDSDFQTYVVLPPLNLRKQIDQLLPLKQRTGNVSQSHFQKDFGYPSRNVDMNMAYNRVNRFFCAFIDHAIKDMDYIIKEKTFVEHLLSCELESFVAEQKGTFYIDESLTFSSLFLYGNQNQIFVMELLIFLAMNLLTNNFIISIIVVCISNKIFQKMFRFWVKNNISTKTLIDKRFLIQNQQMEMVIEVDGIVYRVVKSFTFSSVFQNLINLLQPYLLTLIIGGLKLLRLYNTFNNQKPAE